jgi:hypothetical protein
LLQSARAVSWMRLADVSNRVLSPRRQGLINTNCQYDRQK